MLFWPNAPEVRILKDIFKILQFIIHNPYFIVHSFKEFIIIS